MALNPYLGLPASAFWRTAVAQCRPETVENIYERRFSIAPGDRIATAGSCFAQNIGRRLKRHGYTILDTEPPPRGLDKEGKSSFGYDMYSARYGNVYTARQLLQLIQAARGKFDPADIVWEKDGRFYDALRPNVEPQGLDSPEEVSALRTDHLASVRSMIRQTDVFIFTFGLTEAWLHTESGTVYPTAPGTMAGVYDPQIHSFKNFGYEEVLADFLSVRHIFQRSNPNVRFLLTVSPVPLVATAADQHVLSATTRSKSVLRAVAGALAERYEDVDYFPSYELIASSFSEGRFYEPDRRNVTTDGVDLVMRYFFAQHPPVQAGTRPNAPSPDWVVCEEAMLEAFGA
jgi:hypothetical protein